MSVVNKVRNYNLKLQKIKIQVILQENLTKSTDKESVKQIAWKDCEVYFTFEGDGLDYLDKMTSSHIYQQSITMFFCKQYLHTLIEVYTKQKNRTPQN